MNIERQIGFKAIGIYIFIILMIALALLYGNKLKQQIHRLQESITIQQDALVLTHELVSETAHLLLQTAPYLNTQDSMLINHFEQEVHRIDELIEVLIEKNDTSTHELKQLSLLLHVQASNMRGLQANLSKENPLDYFQSFQEQLQDLEPEVKGSTHLERDTVIKTGAHKKFFQRLREAFRPKTDTTLVIYDSRIDSLEVLHKDSTTTILSRVDSIAKIAGKQYEQNIHSIRLQIDQFIRADREISAEISNLLIQIYNQTLTSIQNTINQSEIIIAKNYMLLVAGGIAVLVLILILIILIIFDVNKGKRAKEKLRQVMETRHQLLLAVSHDIKTPLNTISGYLELGQTEAPQDLEASYLKPMQNAVSHIHALLENLLQFSSLEQGTLKLSLSTLNTKNLAYELQAWFTPLALQKNLDLQFNSAKDCTIQTDVLKLKQICTNIISNAIKYTMKGWVRVMMEVKDSIFILKVSDSGVGIPAEKIETIYEAFVRIEANNTLSEGSGVGMYVVKGLVDLLQGKITIDSQIQKGTTVQIEIPVKQVNRQLPQGKKKVAVFEDNEPMKKVVEEMVKKLGHEVVNQDYNLIITDMEMNEFSGTDILSSHPNIPVILMSGHTDFTTEQALQLGFAGFLPKPFNIDDLRQLIGEEKMQETDSFLVEDDEEIMQIFRQNAIKNQQKLKQMLELKNFKEAQAICHQMLPMFAQLGYPTEALKRMDLSRGKIYQGWTKDVQAIIDIKV